MALELNRPDSERYLPFTIDDVSTADQQYIPVPARGYLKRVVTCLEGALTSADATITIKKNGSTSLGTITVAYTSSAAGDVDTLEISPSASSHFSEAGGDFVEVETDGGSTGTQQLTGFLVFEDRG